MADLQGKDFIALRRLSDRADRTIADVGQTCERVPAGKHGGTVADALRKLLASGKIAPAPARTAKGRAHSESEAV
jgi:hypothetical protein